MLAEPALAIAVSARDWPDRLRESLADHGGARVRLTALSAHDLDDDDHDVLLVDDICSFLTRGLVERERSRGRGVIGVYDPDEISGRDYLRGLGVDEVIASTEGAESFIARVRSVARPVDSPVIREAVDVPNRSLGRVVGVKGISGGVGTSEVALCLAMLLDASTLVELATPASIAQRIGLDLHPNLATAVEIIDHASGDVGAALQPIEANAAVLVGAVEPATGTRGATRRVVDALRRQSSWTLLDQGVSAVAVPVDETIFVTVASPVGVTRCVDALRQVDLTDAHVVLNRAPRGVFERTELMRSVLEELKPRSLTIAPEDSGVTAAAWNGRPVRSGPFLKSMTALAAALGAGS
jgi:hypothetical protein